MSILDYILGRSPNWIYEHAPGPADQTNPVIGKCPRCGIELRAMMWYSCRESPCPAGLAPAARL